MTIDFDTLYRTHYQRVFGTCLKLLGHRAQAEDATQEVFVRAYRSLANYDASRPFAGWVLTIASNHCIDVVRRRANRAEPFADDGDGRLGSADSPTDGALDLLLSAERDAEIRDAIAALPDRYRVPIVLAYFEHLSYDEIAARLGITRNHVGVLLLRARRTLRLSLSHSHPELASCPAHPS